MEVSGQLNVPAGLPSGKDPGTQSTGVCVGSKAGMRIFEKKSIAPALTPETKTNVRHNLTS